MFGPLRITAALLFAGIAIAIPGEAGAAPLLPELAVVLASGEATKEMAPPAERQAPVEPQRYVDGSTVLPAAPSSSTGAPTSVGSGSVIAAFVTADGEMCGELLIAYFNQESRLLLPVPFLSGVFRPPRWVC